ncbi:MAG: glycosyltransferase, partial [Pseudomonadota bacterium]|nr:glycosyltransferase [Pseudomonadota bacterium]
MSDQPGPIYIALISVHGLIRGNNLELGRDADTGGQTLYVLELAQALSECDDVAQVDLITRHIKDEHVSPDYAVPVELINDKFRIVRIDAGPDEYIYKEQLWDHLDVFADNLADFFREQNHFPDLIHSHYADAGLVGSHVANLLGIPLVHTGHSLGRVKRRRLLASGLSAEQVEQLYNMSRRVEAEEMTFATAERVITSTHQEIEEQYEIYDHYQPEQMRVIPPGTNITQFKPPVGGELQDDLFGYLTAHLTEANKPIILALSRPDKRKNIGVLIEAYGESEELQRLANLVIIAGNRDDIPDFLHSMDIFTLPSLGEGVSNTILEAMATGLPIIATDVGGTPELVTDGENGLLVLVDDVQALTDGIEKLVSDKALRENMGN